MYHLFEEKKEIARSIRISPIFANSFVRIEDVQDNKIK